MGYVHSLLYLNLGMDWDYDRYLLKEETFCYGGLISQMSKSQRTWQEVRDRGHTSVFVYHMFFSDLYNI